MYENRTHTRTPMKCQVKVTHPDIGSVIVNTRDISDGGIFILTEDHDMPPVGSIVEAQVQNMGMEGPIIKMEIVRVEPGGLGLKFVK